MQTITVKTHSQSFHNIDILTQASLTLAIFSMGQGRREMMMVEVSLVSSSQEMGPALETVCSHQLSLTQRPSAERKASQSLSKDKSSLTEWSTKSKRSFTQTLTTHLNTQVKTALKSTNKSRKDLKKSTHWQNN